MSSSSFRPGFSFLEDASYDTPGFLFETFLVSKKWVPTVYYWLTSLAHTQSCRAEIKRREVKEGEKGELSPSEEGCQENAIGTGHFPRSSFPFPLRQSAIRFGMAKEGTFCNPCKKGKRSTMSFLREKTRAATTTSGNGREKERERGDSPEKRRTWWIEDTLGGRLEAEGGGGGGGGTEHVNRVNGPFPPPPPPSASCACLG